ncbi:NAD(P)-dependent oxidoreductase [Polymorphobacter sp.]|uniref:NAD(P)-dependent oxidoreductase n=1 Tax=Polymorphobacter sp. TaxID=1909290 RepID=UPI003F7049CF
MIVTVIGLGAMGAALATRLLSQGHQVTVWNRTPARADPLVAAGATLAPSLEAAAAADLIVTMVADDQALLALAPTLAAHMPPGALHVSMSTIAPETATTVAALHADHGQHYLAAPVFGRPPAAEAGQLFILAAGAPEALARATPLFEAIGKAHFPLGDTPSQANVAKLAGNYMILATTAALGEALSAGQANNIPPATLLNVFTSTLFDSPITRNYGAMLVEHRFHPAGFTAQLGTKDLRLFRETAPTAPLADLLQTQLQTLIARHGPDIDWAAIGMLTPVQPETQK